MMLSMAKAQRDKVPNHIRIDTRRAKHAFLGLTKLALGDPVHITLEHVVVVTLVVLTLVTLGSTLGEHVVVIVGVIGIHYHAKLTRGLTKTF